MTYDQRKHGKDSLRRRGGVDGREAGHGKRFGLPPVPHICLACTARFQKSAPSSAALPQPLSPCSAPRSAKGHLLNAGICLLCSADVATVRGALERYCDTDINFDNSREHTFLAVRAWLWARWAAEAAWGVASGPSSRRLRPATAAVSSHLLPYPQPLRRCRRRCCRPVCGAGAG